MRSRAKAPARVPPGPLRTAAAKAEAEAPTTAAAEAEEEEEDNDEDEEGREEAAVRGGGGGSACRRVRRTLTGLYATVVMSVARTPAKPLRIGLSVLERYHGAPA